MTDLDRRSFLKAAAAAAVVPALGALVSMQPEQTK